MKNNLNLIFISFFLFFAFITQGQEFYYVIAENGLIVREKPNSKSKRIGKLYSGEPVELIENTNIELEIKENNKIIKGKWYFVVSQTRSMSELKGYVFSGYLLKYHKHWNAGGGCDNYEIVCKSEFSTKSSDFSIYNVQTADYGNASKKKDTLLLYEEGFNEIGDKLLKIKPKENYKNIEVFYTTIETLNDWGETKNSDGIVPKWKGNKPYIKLEPTNDFYYRLPVIDYVKIREATAKKLNLTRSPDWDYLGEGWWYARYKYKGIIVPYEIKSVLIKIITTDIEDNVRTEFVEIELSYGC
jgi:uncharacterized protein YgiM (DUF1202 family)